MSRFLPFLLACPLFACISCETTHYNPAGLEYPEGLKVVNLISQSNCDLPKCSSGRVRRLKAKDLRALVVNDSTLQVGLTFDSVIHLSTCEKLDPTFLKSSDTISWVILSGDLYDACGAFEFDWPIEEGYIVHIDEIRRD